MAAHDTHHQPRAGAGIAEIEHLFGGEQGAEAGPFDPPLAIAQALDLRPQSAAGGGGAQHIIAFQQPLNGGHALGEQAEDDGAMGDGFIAWRLKGARKGFRAARRHRLGGSMGGMGSQRNLGTAKRFRCVRSTPGRPKSPRERPALLLI